MKRFFSLIFVFVLIFSVAACSKKKKEEIPGYEEQVSKEIKAEEGGTVESKDGKTSVEIPAGALDEDTTIIMTIYDASGYESEGKKVLSKVVDFEPNGTIFKKPVIIKMAAGEKVEDKTIVAAVYDEGKQDWSYSQGFYLKLGEGKNEAGDPMMMTTDEKEVTVENGNLTAAGDPIMMTNAAGDPIMTNAAGDPIMMSAAGDPIMLASAGDPIMSSAAGDPIMNAAAGDPIMMTTGHFTVYAFLVFDPRKGDEKPVEEPDKDDPVDDGDSEPVTPDDDADTASPDEDIIPEPEPVYSKVICTGLRNCFGEDGVLDECPKEGEALNGQDAGYIFRKSCVPKSFEVIKDAGEETPTQDGSRYSMTKDNNTGLAWLFTWVSGERDENVIVDYETQASVKLSEYCDSLEYDGHDDWRLPTPKEFLTIADHDIFNDSYMALRSAAFPGVTGGCEGCQTFWTSVEGFIFITELGAVVDSEQSSFNGLMCVRGDKYGEVAASDYTSKNENGEEMIFDSKTNLFWQKTSVSGKTWTAALEYCEGLNYAGHDDWRLPNKNELASLVDYSKSNPASSFPGLPAENFITSTFTKAIGAVAIDMKTGEMGLRMADHPQVKSKIRGIDSGETYSVICVRSDLTPYPANGIPACGADGYSPCKDANNITWSQRLIYNEYEMESVHWSNVAKDCRNMKGGKWRIPTIDDVRSLFTDDVFKTGGACGVTVEHSDYSAYESDCSSDEVAGHETALRDYGILFSGTFSNANADYERDQWNVWTIDMMTGGMSDVSTVYAPQLVVRCVLDNTIEDPKPLPYTDEANGLVWSSISEEGDWRDAVEYCGTLVEGGSDNWRVPTMDELQTLIKNCDLEGNDACAPDLTGKYSLFSDFPILLSSDVFDGSYMTTIDFIDLMTDQNKNLWDKYYDLQVRCVRSASDPLEDPDNFAEPFPYSVTNDMLWSEKSELITGTVEDAMAYCESLNEAEYGGYNEWSLPYVWDYLNILIEEGEDLDCSGACREDIVLNEGETEACFCDYTFKSRSIFNDYGKFWTSDKNEGEDDWSEWVYPYLFDFTTGEVVGGSNENDPWSNENSGYVRCVMYLQV